MARITQLSKANRAVLAHLAEHGPATVDALATALDRAERTVGGRLRVLKQMGYVRPHGPRWMVTAAGRALLTRETVRG